MITLTSSAEKHFSTLAEQHGFKGFRFGVTGGGCAGFNYALEGAADPAYPDDEVIQIGDVTMWVDRASVMYVLGTEINWATDIMGSRFEFDNPLAKNSCGCNKSFGI